MSDNADTPLSVEDIWIVKEQRQVKSVIGIITLTWRDRIMKCMRATRIT